MNSKELVLNTLSHQETPRLPWVPFAGVHAGSLIGKTATEILSDGDVLYNALEKVVELYQPDGLPIIFDLQVEAEILGCDLVWADKAPASVSSHPLALEGGLPCDCKQPTKESGRLPMILDVMRRSKQTWGEDLALYGLICGPFTLASHLRGNDLFMDMILDEEYIKSLLQYTTKTAMLMIDYYIEAGMDVIAVVDPLVSQISPDHFSLLCHDAFKQVFDYIRLKERKSAFFVCGNATMQLDVMCKTGPDCVSVDENVNMVTAKEVTDQYNITLGGNIPLTTLMLHGTQQENMKYVIDMVDSLSKGNLIVSPGCDMPFDVPTENAIGVAQTVREFESIKEMVKNYEAPELDIEIILPQYDKLEKPLIEVFTLDSATCAACTYMMGAMNVAKDHFKEDIDLIEYKFTEKENIARCIKMGIKNLPCVYINGELKWSSIIPSKEELFKVIKESKKR